MDGEAGSVGGVTSDAGANSGPGNIGGKSEPSAADVSVFNGALANAGFGDAKSNPEIGNHPGTQGPATGGGDYAAGSPNDPNKAAQQVNGSWVENTINDGRRAFIDAAQRFTDQFAKRVKENPQDLQDAAKLLSYFPSNIATDALVKELQTQNPEDFAALTANLNNFLQRQATAVKNGELSPEAAALAGTAALIAAYKLAPKGSLSKVAQSISTPINEVFSAAKSRLGVTFDRNALGTVGGNIKFGQKGAASAPVKGAETVEDGASAAAGKEATPPTAPYMKNFEASPTVKEVVVDGATGRPVELPMNVTHVLDGEVKNNFGGKRAVGGHFVGSPDVKVVEWTKAADGKGVREAVVQIRDRETGKWVTKSKPSTTFPENWTRRQTEMEVRGAFANARTDPLDPDKWQGVSPSGIVIEGYYSRTPSGLLIDADTAYPVYKGT